ncbi:MAG: MetQ/NlpA family ABC transporter substrate-binding protein [Dehalococcoidia bacterium]|nr:MetQ/NlpA family ABC transporter substrate-binding protein [Dehalococcoidia bacterium]
MTQEQEERMQYRILVSRWFLAALGLVLVGQFALACSSGEAPTPTPAATATPTPIKVRVGLLPIIDSLPFFVAEKEGLFADEKLQVELVLFASALERDTALQTGGTDAQLADLIASGVLNRDKERIKIVDTTHRATPEKGMIFIVAGPKSNIQKPEDLKGKKIGVSENSLIDYITDSLTEKAGLKPGDISKVSVPRIPDRTTLLSQGALDAASLPEPAASLAVSSGGRVILEDGPAGIGVSVLEFRTEFLKDNRAAVERFVRAHQKAIALVNANRAKYQPLLAEKANLPDSIKTTFPVPAFPEQNIPSRQDVQAAVDWMVRRGLLDKPLTYEQLVDTTLLKK